LARLIVVSNRVSAPVRNAERAGGLEVALQAVFKNHPGVWFGWSGRVVASKEEIETRTTELDGQQYIVTDLTREDNKEYYNGFANRVLWPILHYRLDLAEYSFRDLTGYLRVNEHFADEIHKIIQPDDIVWVHDYHLIPLAKALRERGHRNKIGFFLHIPLPPPEILTALPGHDRLFHSFYDYDLIGFQTETDRVNFARYLVNDCKLATRDLETFLAGDRTIKLGAFPVSIDVDEVARWSQQGARSKLARELEGSLGGRKMIIGVDRLDYSKGLIERMRSFGKFLEQYPHWQNRVAYIQVTPRSRSKIQEYADMDAQVGSMVGKINGTYGQVAWTPIRYVNKSYARSSLAALYRLGSVGLVTPLRDGMNLVAKEYVASQNPADPGVLILSRFAGASHELSGAMLVNPYDTDSVADAIDQALNMTLEERRERHEQSFEALKANDIALWGERFLNELAMKSSELSMFAAAFPKAG